MIRFMTSHSLGGTGMPQDDFSESQLFSRYITHIVSRRGIGELEKVAASRKIGLLTIHLTDFNSCVGVHGPAEGLRLVGRLHAEALQHFEQHFQGCRLILAEPSEIGKLVICFEMPDDMAWNFSNTARQFRFGLFTRFNRNFPDKEIIQPFSISVGYTHFRRDENEPLETLFFREFCRAQQVALENTGHPAVWRNMTPETALPENPLHPEVPKLQDFVPGGAGTLRLLVRQGLNASPDTLIRDAKEMLRKKPPMTSLVVVKGRKPVGLIMNYELDRRLSSLYGVSLYHHREIGSVMDRTALMADAERPVEEVARLAMSREDDKIYDDVIVTDSGCFLGTISIRKLLDHLAGIQVKIAMGANPLSGLPGNVVIEQEICSRMCCNKPASLIYIDLDNFKVYNDAYGFDNGDKLILFTARTIREAAEKCGTPGDFVGHVGGDDFVIIAGQESAPEICRHICETFDREIPGFYTEEDRAKGHIAGTGRDGVQRMFPFVSVSIGMIDCAFAVPFTMNEMSHRVAEIKKYAKSFSGNAYVKDRRAPLGSAAAQSSGVRMP